MVAGADGWSRVVIAFVVARPASPCRRSLLAGVAVGDRRAPVRRLARRRGLRGGPGTRRPGAVCAAARRSPPRTRVLRPARRRGCARAATRRPRRSWLVFADVATACCWLLWRCSSHLFSYPGAWRPRVWVILVAAPPRAAASTRACASSVEKARPGRRRRAQAGDARARRGGGQGADVRGDPAARHLLPGLRERLPVGHAGRLGHRSRPARTVDRHGVPSINWYHRGERRYVDYGSSGQAVRTFGVLRTLTDTVYNMNFDHLSRAQPTFFERLDDAGVRTACTPFLIFRGRTRHELGRPGLAAPGRPGGQLPARGLRARRSCSTASSTASRTVDCPPTLARPGHARPVLGLRGRATSSAHDLYDFMLFSLPDNDHYSHRLGPDATVTSIARADRHLERARRGRRRRRARSSTTTR